MMRLAGSQVISGFESAAENCVQYAEETGEAFPEPRVRTFVVAVYLVDRAYGGPEEGGWWYSTGDRIRVMRVFRNEALAVAYADRLNERLATTLNKGRRSISSALSTGRYAAEVHDNDASEHYPRQRPHYE